MKLPFIVIVDDDEQVLHAITRDIRLQYQKGYKILSTSSASEAIEALTELKNSGDSVALFLVDQRMPEMEGVDFLQKALKIFPEAKRILQIQDRIIKDFPEKGIYSGEDLASLMKTEMPNCKIILLTMHTELLKINNIAGR